MIITSILNSYIFYVFGAKIWKNTVLLCSLPTYSGPVLLVNLNQMY